MDLLDKGSGTWNFQTGGKRERPQRKFWGAVGGDDHHHPLLLVIIVFNNRWVAAIRPA